MSKPGDLRLPERFWRKVSVDRTTGCWMWSGGRTSKGYGCFWFQGAMRGAHRLSFERLQQAIPNGLVIDHLCRRPGCVNPAHMEVVTNRENILRSPLSGRVKASCAQGHEYSPENTYWSPSTRPYPRRACRTCRTARNRARSAKQTFAMSA